MKHKVTLFFSLQCASRRFETISGAAVCDWIERAKIMLTLTKNTRYHYTCIVTFLEDCRLNRLSSKSPGNTVRYKKFRSTLCVDR